MDILLPVLALTAIILGLAGVVLPLLPGTPRCSSADSGFWPGPMASPASANSPSSRSASFRPRWPGALTISPPPSGYSAWEPAAWPSPGRPLVPCSAWPPGWLAFSSARCLEPSPASGWARRDGAQASRAGLAAGISFLLGTVAKICIAFAMVGIFAVAWLL